jgi:hypothetical protein
MLSRAAFPIFEYDILYTGVVMGCQKKLYWYWQGHLKAVA